MQDNQPEDYSKLRERQIFYVVSVPGETAWAKEVSLSFFFSVEKSAHRSLLPSQSLDETSVAGTLISSALLIERS